MSFAVDEEAGTVQMAAVLKGSAWCDVPVRGHIDRALGGFFWCLADVPGWFSAFTILFGVALEALYSILWLSTDFGCLLPSPSCFLSTHRLLAYPSSTLDSRIALGFSPDGGMDPFGDAVVFQPNNIMVGSAA